MADRLDYYYRQKVTEAELDLAFSLLEKADRNLASDMQLRGVISGAVAAPHAPVANLTIDLTGPATAYDQLGQRVAYGTGQTVDCSVDLVGVPTEVTKSGNERWLGVFLRFRRQLSDPRTDGNSVQVYFRRDESFELIVRQAPEGAIGSAPKVELQAEELLICEIRRRFGQTQIVNSDIDISRRQVFVFAPAKSVSVEAGGWRALAPAKPQVQASLDAVDSVLSDHLSGTARRHAAGHIEAAAYRWLDAANVQGVFKQIVDKLAKTADYDSGAMLIGADAIAGSPNSLPDGDMRDQLYRLLAFINQTANDLTSTVGAMKSVANGNSGAHLVGIDAIGGSPAYINAGPVRNAMADLLGRVNVLLNAFEHGHLLTDPIGEHRMIYQSYMGQGRNLIFDSAATFYALTRFRIYADGQTVSTPSIWLTVNVSWDASAGTWKRDAGTAPACALRLANNEFAFHIATTAENASFTNWTTTWRLPMNSDVNSAFEVTGKFKEIGRLGMRGSPNFGSAQSMRIGGAVTFRSRFPDKPSSITFTMIEQVNSPTVTAGSVDRDGFTYDLFVSNLAAGQQIVWFGTYTAVS